MPSSSKKSTNESISLKPRTKNKYKKWSGTKASVSVITLNVRNIQTSLLKNEKGNIKMNL